MPFGLSVVSFISAVIAIVFGIIVIAKPEVLAYLIGAYLIFIGIIYFVGC